MNELHNVLQRAQHQSRLDGKTCNTSPEKIRERLGNFSRTIRFAASEQHHKLVGIRGLEHREHANFLRVSE